MNYRLIPHWLQLRNRLRALSYSMRFALAVSVTFCAATILAGSVSYVLLSQELKSRLADDARVMAENLAVTLGSGDTAELKSQIAAQSRSTRDFSALYLFVDNSGKTVVGNFSVNIPFTGSRRMTIGNDVFLNSKSQNKAGEAYQAFGLRVPVGWIITARDIKWITDSREVLVQSVAWGLGVALALSIGLALFLARRNESRINRLNAVLRGAAKGDLTLRFADNNPDGDDISRVAEGVNEMLGRLAQSMESLRQVSTDITHDLRSPLTRLRTRLEPHYLRQDLPEDTRTDLKFAMEEMDNIAATFEAVLRLAQIESGAVAAEMKPVNLSEICDSMFEMLLPVAEDMGHDFSLKAEQPAVMLTGDKDLLAQAIVNLVENAFRYCPPPASIILSVGVEGGNRFIRVSDTGPGIPKAERAKVLRRFYRLEKSRKLAGSGLGLSLVSAIARLHGGEIRLSDNSPGLGAELWF